MIGAFALVFTLGIIIGHTIGYIMGKQDAQARD